MKHLVLCAISRKPSKAVIHRLEAISDKLEKISNVVIVKTILVVSDRKREKNGTFERSKLRGLKVIDLGRLETSFPIREERLAHCRNAYMEELDSMEAVPDAVVIVDPDAGKFGNTNFDLAIDYLGKYAGVFANWKSVYYDILALRKSGWVEQDYRTLKPSKKNSMRFGQQFEMFNPIAKTQPPIEIESAFGGLALYRGSSIRGVRYSAPNESGFAICEHVEFNRRIRQNGGALAILPNFQVLGNNRHTLLWRFFVHSGLVSKTLAKDL